MKILSIILAAGKGNRMKSKIPKPFHKIANLKMIDWVINVNKSIDVNKLIIVGSENEFFLPYKDKYDLCIQKNPDGTGGALKSAKHLFKGYNDIVLVCYGDTPFISKNTLLKLIKAIKQNNDIALTCFKKNELNAYGKVLLSSEKKPIKIIEDKKSTHKISLCNGGLMAFNGTKLLELLKKLKKDQETNEYFLTDVVELANNAGLNIKPVTINEKEILGINNKKELSEAENLAQQLFRKKALEKGITLLDPKTVYFSYNTIIEKDVIIHPNVILGQNVKIKENSEIFPFSCLEDCIINNNAKIGPFARIRGETNIAQNSKIGNFVEIKNSKVGKGVKINHLAYVGDTDIGHNTNIGAGTITCNFDGFKKNKTTIGYETFVGSNSTIIAPIKIDNHSTIAAGSVITENVPQNSLAISRSYQENKKNKSIKKIN